MANTEGDRVLFSRYSPLREIGDAVIVRLAGGGSLPHLRVLAATLGQPREPHSRQASSIGQLANAESRLHLPAHQARLRALLSSQPLRDTKLAERLPQDTRLLSWLPDEQQRPHVAVEPRHARREHQGVV